MQPEDMLPIGQPLKVNEDTKSVKKGRPLDSKLKQNKFAYLYALNGDWSGKRCAIEAGYSTASAANTATSLLKKPHVQARIKEVQAATPHYVIRKPKEEREKLYSQYYEMAYINHFQRLMSEMGWHERECVDRRQDMVLRWKYRVQGNRDYNIIHKQCVEFALAYCDKLFGPLNRKKPRYDKFTQKWQYRSVKGCAYEGGK